MGKNNGNPDLVCENIGYLFVLSQNVCEGFISQFTTGFVV